MIDQTCQVNPEPGPDNEFLVAPGCIPGEDGKCTKCGNVSDGAGDDPVCPADTTTEAPPTPLHILAAEAWVNSLEAPNQIHMANAPPELQEVLGFFLDPDGLEKCQATYDALCRILGVAAMRANLPGALLWPEEVEALRVLMGVEWRSRDQKTFVQHVSKDEDTGEETVTESHDGPPPSLFAGALQMWCLAQRVHWQIRVMQEEAERAKTGGRSLIVPGTDAFGAAQADVIQLNREQRRRRGVGRG